MKSSLAALGAAFACAGCITYPTSEERFNDVIVATNRDPNTDFAAFDTFAIAPAIDYLDASAASPMPVPLDGSVATPLSEEVARQLTLRGYQEVDPSDDPELGVKITVIKSTVESYSYAPIWGYGSFSWGYYYPYFVPVYYGYDTTLVLIDLIDVRSAVPATANEAQTQLPGVWTAGVYGVLENTVATEVGQAVAGIDQAFEQSPYLRSAQ
jgi:Domain of unknown function (DUF4136)